MTNEEIVEQIQKGNKLLQTDLLQQNQGIVFKLANQYSNGCDEDEEDLRQELSITLLTCAEKFSRCRGANFITFSLPWLRNTCFEFLNRRSLIHIPREWYSPVRLYHSLKDDGLTDHEVMQTMRLHPVQFAKLQQTAAAADRPASLSTPIVGADGSTELSDLIADPEDAFVSVENALEQAELRRMIAEIPEPHKTVLRLRYDGELKQGEIAERMGITLKDARRLLQQAHRMLEKELLKAETIETSAFCSSRLKRFRNGNRTSSTEELAIAFAEGADGACADGDVCREAGGG